MFYFARCIRKLINSNCVNSRSFLLLNRNSSVTARKDLELLTNTFLSCKPCLAINSFNFKIVNLDHYLQSKRLYSKKKGSKRIIEKEEEESDRESDEEEFEQSADVDEILGDNIIKKNVSSLRLDSIIKAALGLTKKKIEQEFYAFKLRVNGKPVVKKALNVHVGDEIDVVKGFSPDTSKYLTVDRIIIKGIDKVTGTGQFPVKMEVLKKLTIENYEEPWNPAALGELNK